MSGIGAVKVSGIGAVKVSDIGAGKVPSISAVKVSITGIGTRCQELQGFEGHMSLELQGFEVYMVLRARAPTAQLWRWPAGRPQCKAIHGRRDLRADLTDRERWIC